MPEPTNMKRVKLPIAGLVPGEFNALVAWHPKVSFDQPLLIVLFFHGLEDAPWRPPGTATICRNRSPPRTGTPC